LEWMRRYPQTVRRVVLDGVAPADMVLPLSYSADGQAALDAMFAACEKEVACARRHRGLRRSWDGLLARLPRDVELVDPMTGTSAPTHLTRTLLLQAVRAALYSPATAAALPTAIAEAAAGRFQALAGLGSLADPGPRGDVALGMHFSVVCAEDVPIMATARMEPGRDVGTSLATLYTHICGDWPRLPVPAGFYDLPPAGTAPPTLVLSGGLDPVTPPRHGERVAKALGSRSRHVVVAHAGHGILALPCMRNVLSTFVETRDDAAALAVETHCVTGIPRPHAFVPISAVRPPGIDR
jgi:pimeloyl-ACP methyl ester carboxylesterase